MLQRMDLLRVLIERSIRSAGAGVNSMDLMTELYSLRWVLHPEGEDQEYKLGLYLESLVSSGDLVKTGSEFVVASHAILTLEKYEEEERRHRDNLRLQKGMIFLTLLIALLALIQAGLIRFPVLLDFSAQ